MRHSIASYFAFATTVGIFAILLCSGCSPATPRENFVGDWRPQSTFPVELRSLPPSTDVWSDFKGWRSSGRGVTNRYYVARLGGSEQQHNLTITHHAGDTPLGASVYTSAYFGYVDKTNGTYTFKWMMRGRHDPNFLRFTSQIRSYYLVPIGVEDEYPPVLAIVAIEGVSPF